MGAHAAADARARHRSDAGLEFEPWKLQGNSTVGGRLPKSQLDLASIEEQILELHASKRGLAEDLLGGMESARPLDLETLGELLGG